MITAQELLERDLPDVNVKSLDRHVGLLRDRGTITKKMHATWSALSDEKKARYYAKCCGADGPRSLSRGSRAGGPMSGAALQAVILAHQKAG